MKYLIKLNFKKGDRSFPGRCASAPLNEMESVQERMERLGTYAKIASFMQKEKEDYAFKRKYAQIRAEEFASECDKR